MEKKNNSVQLGLLAGIISIILGLIQLLFFADKMGTGGFGPNQIIGFLNFAILIFFMFKAASDLKKANGGVLSFKNALKSNYIVAVVASFLGFVFVLLSKFILFPEVYDNITKRTIEKTREKLESQGQTEETIDMAVDMTEKFADMGFWFYLPILLILYFIIALIIAAIVKKKPEVA